MKKNQQGMATILILLFVGMALTATVLGGHFYVKGMQEQQSTALASTQAQMRAWQGLDIAQSVFANMTSAQLQALATATAGGVQTITLTGVNNIALQVTSALPTTNPTQFSITVTGSAATGTPLAASSRLAANIVITPGSPPTPPRLLSGVSIEGDLKMSGDIKIFEGDISNFEIIVKGDVDLKSNSITTLESDPTVIRATGNINVESSSDYGLLHANGNVTMSGSTRADAVLARGNIVHKSSKDIIYAATNQDLTVQAGTVHDLLVGQTLIITGDAKLSPTAGYAAKNFDPAIVGYTIQTLAQFDTANGYDGSTNKPKYDKVKNQINKTAANWVTTPNVREVSGLVVNIPMVEINSDEAFNAYDYKSLANYAFTVDKDNKIKVQVKRVTGIADGDYFLCGTKLIPNANCIGLDAESNQIALTASGIKYDASLKTWTLEATDKTVKNIAPGIVWFEGNITAKGTYYNTFIATLTFKSREAQIYSPNYAAFSGMQNGTRYAPQGYCNDTDFGLKPSQLCSTNTTNSWNSEIDGGIGNFSAMAGSLNKVDNKTYEGGNIAFLNTNEIFGNVWAGNLYGTDAEYGGSITLHGYIKAQARGDKSSNIIKNSTTIDLKKLPPNFRPSTGVIKPGTPGTAPVSPQVRWVRYL
ncbi:hypothetical protein [Iodobacter sp.]|uniref:hypothetical protein n=1 Tax=Iodobacter sp. TaxID=1915058 RepID=UPI0025E06C59|nr:hypothetical protein [Iodobacter sp.]